MNDNQLSKYELIEKGIYDEYKSERYVLKKLKVNVYDLNQYPMFYNFELYRDNFKGCERIYNSISRRKTRVFNKILSWYYYVSKNDDKRLIFGTLTFTDEILLKTSKKTRRVYVSRFLNDNTEHYISNIDFGKKDDREHYHFIALVNKKIKKDSWPYGFDFYSNIKKTCSLRNRKNYLLKLTNHSYKDTTKQEKLITDRNSYNSLVVFIGSNLKDYNIFKDNFYLELQKHDKSK